MFADYRFWFATLIPVFFATILFIMSRIDLYKKRIDNVNRGFYRVYEPTTYYGYIGFGVITVLSLMFTSLFWGWGKSLRLTNDIPEQIGGFVVEKYSEDGSHEESYQCNCRSVPDSDGEGSHTECDTCWRTVYHRDFYVINNTGDWWSGYQWYQRSDKPSKNKEPYHTPDWFTDSYIGMPVSLDHAYKDYLTAIYGKDYKLTYDGLIEAGLEDTCPDYPYYRLDMRAVQKITFGNGFSDKLVNTYSKYNIAPKKKMSASYIESLEYTDVPIYMDTLFGYSGTHYQADLMVIFLKGNDINLVNLCMAKWNRGPKNGLYLFLLGNEDANNKFIPEKAVVDFAVVGDKKNSDFNDQSDDKSNFRLKFELESALAQYFKGGEFDFQTVLRMTLVKVDSYWNRMEMRNFQDLEQFIYPTDRWMKGLAIWNCVATIISLLISIALYTGELEF